MAVDADPLVVKGQRALDDGDLPSALASFWSWPPRLGRVGPFTPVSVVTGRPGIGFLGRQDVVKIRVCPSTGGGSGEMTDRACHPCSARAAAARSMGAGVTSRCDP